MAGGMECPGVWNCIFSVSEFQISEPKILRKSLFLRHFRDSLSTAFQGFTGNVGL